MNTRKARIAELTKLIAAEEISIANGATPQLDDDGNVIVDMATCGTCHTSWNDALITGRTPAPSARCPYEYIHAEIAELKALTNRSRRTPKQLEAFARMNAGRTNLARARKVLTRDELFFYEHAGYSYDPQTESADEGRVRCARELAKAEAFVKGQEYEYEWEYDESGCGGCACDSPDCKCSTGEEHETLCVCLFNPRDRVTDKYATLASLGGICGADANYRRVVEAELALEAMHNYDRETEVLDAH